MPRSVPTYRHRKGYDQAIVTLRDSVTRQARDHWLGPYDSPRSRELYHRLIAEWEASGRRLVEAPPPESAVPSGLTIVELARQYWDFAGAHYSSKDLSHIKLMMRVLVRLCGSSPAASFGPNKLRQVREAMVLGDPEDPTPRRPRSRKYIDTQGLARRRVRDGRRATRIETLAEWRQRLGEQRWQEVLTWRKTHRWHPYQLRHSAATRIRRQFRLEAAQIASGHSGALITEAVYAERDMQKAVVVMRRIG